MGGGGKDTSVLTICAIWNIDALWRCFVKYLLIYQLLSSNIQFGFQVLFLIISLFTL